MDIAEIHKNSKVLIDGVPYNADDVDFVKPGKGRAIYRVRLRNLATGEGIDRTYHSGDKLDEAHISTQEMQYLYKEGAHYVFMNTETFEQYLLTEEGVGDKKNFLKDGTVVQGLMMGDKPIDITLPTFVELKVTEGEVSTRKETFSAQSKQVLLETGYAIDAPTFVKPGDIIKVDTRTGAYLERVSKK